MTRAAKTPRQRAEEAYAVAQRLASRLQAKHAALAAETERVGRERDAAFTRRDFLAKHPDLQENPPA